MRLCDLHDALPKKLTDTLEQAMPRIAGLLPGFDAHGRPADRAGDAQLIPVRIVRGEDCQSELRGLYPCGEVCGLRRRHSLCCRRRHAPAPRPAAPEWEDKT